MQVESEFLENIFIKFQLILDSLNMTHYVLNEINATLFPNFMITGIREGKLAYLLN